MRLPSLLFGSYWTAENLTVPPCADYFAGRKSATDALAIKALSRAWKTHEFAI
jgi:hypothetical protein